MNNKQARTALKFDWSPWLKRPFFAFILSLFENSSSKRAFKKIDLLGWELISFMFNNGEWYWSEKSYKLAEPAIKEWLQSHRISEIDDRLKIFYQENKEKIIKLVEKPEERTKEKLTNILDILVEINTYVWAVHVLEHYLIPELKAKSSKYIKHNLDKFIGDASYPEKKNALELMEEEIRKGTSYKILVKKYGWMRARDGFARGYSICELMDHAKTLNKKIAPHQHSIIPKSLNKLFADARELVYLRTRRTDILYEFLFLARPLLKITAKKYHIPFGQLRYYTLHSLINGKPIKYPKNFGCVSYKEKLFFFNKPILNNDLNTKEHTEIKGSVAYQGIVRGTARVVMKVSEIGKVKKGDILISYMTSPNFLQAMKLSAAFVTNEGGLTCHAAIVAREIKKPCVIGTGIATDVFKDGDLVEVDANKGVVRLIKK